jgi:hypothetical protein
MVVAFAVLGGLVLPGYADALSPPDPPIGQFGITLVPTQGEVDGAVACTNCDPSYGYNGSIAYVTLTRNGTVIASSNNQPQGIYDEIQNGGLEGGIRALEPGDVADLYVNGSHVGSMTYTGEPTVDPYLCGTSTVTGTTGGYTIEDRDGTVTTSGARYTVTLSQPSQQGGGTTVFASQDTTGPTGQPADYSVSAVSSCSYPPVNTSPPTISGTAAVGQMLTAIQGSWTNSPTSYSYQWEDCDGSGANCSPIAGAVGTSYTIALSDAGHTIRVEESASNRSGTGGPVQSASSTFVSQPPPPLCADGPTATNETFPATIGARLSATLSATPGDSPIVSWNLLRQDFGTSTYQFEWGGNGTFSLTPHVITPVHFTYSVSDTLGCTSVPVTATISPESGADLVSSLTASSRHAVIGSRVSYTAKVYNLGPLSAFQPQIRGQIPAGEKLIGPAHLGSSLCTGGANFYCYLGSLASGQSKTIRWTVSIIGPSGPQKTTLAAHSDQTQDPNLLNNAISWNLTILSRSQVNHDLGGGQVQRERTWPFIPLYPYQYIWAKSGVDLNHASSTDVQLLSERHIDSDRCGYMRPDGSVPGGGFNLSTDIHVGGLHRGMIFLKKIRWTVTDTTPSLASGNFEKALIYSDDGKQWDDTDYGSTVLGPDTGTLSGETTYSENHGAQLTLTINRWLPTSYHHSAAETTIEVTFNFGNVPSSLRANGLLASVESDNVADGPGGAQQLAPNTCDYVEDQTISDLDDHPAAVSSKDMVTLTSIPMPLGQQEKISAYR